MSVEIIQTIAAPKRHALIPMVHLIAVVSLDMMGMVSFVKVYFSSLFIFSVNLFNNGQISMNVGIIQITATYTRPAPTLMDRLIVAVMTVMLGTALFVKVLPLHMILYSF